MRWKTTAGWPLMSFTLVGCAHTFGKGGSMDRDQKNLLDTSRTGLIHEMFCAGGRQNTERCRWALANPEEAAALMSEEEE